jgi:Domain of unknown function (DUF4386)
MNEGEILPGPKLRHAAIITVIGYVSGWGVPFASFYVIPKLFSPDNAAKTAQNIVANQGLFVATIFAFLINFIGDVLAAGGLYLLLRPVNAAISMLAAGLRVVFATVCLAALGNLVTVHRLLTRPASLTALGQDQLNAQVEVAFGSFNSQFAFSLIIFGVHLIALGWLIYRSGYIPNWLGIVLAINGAGWILIESGPYLFPGVNLGIVWVATFGELILLVWLIGWGTRLREPIPSRASS